MSMFFGIADSRPSALQQLSRTIGRVAGVLVLLSLFGVIALWWLLNPIHRNFNPNPILRSYLPALAGSDDMDFRGAFIDGEYGHVFIIASSMMTEDAARDLITRAAADAGWTEGNGVLLRRAGNDQTALIINGRANGEFLITLAPAAEIGTSRFKRNHKRALAGS